MEKEGPMALLRRSIGFKRAGWLILAATGLMLGSCGTGAYVDSRREAGQKEPVGTSTPNLVAICYSKTATSTEETLKLAESECAKTGRIPKYHHEDRWTCTMIAPRRIFFSCVAKP
jgi:hypothetical protein